MPFRILFKLLLQQGRMVIVIIWIIIMDVIALYLFRVSVGLYLITTQVLSED